jgi:hypothetical protein
VWASAINKKRVVGSLKSAQRPFVLAIGRLFKSTYSDAALILVNLIPLHLELGKSVTKRAISPLAELLPHSQIMHGELRNLHEMINLAKRSFLESQILEAGGKKTSLFKLVDSLLLVKPGLRLPAHDSLTELVKELTSRRRTR